MSWRDSFFLLLRAQHSVVRKSTHMGRFISEVLCTLCKDSMSIGTCVLRHIWFVGLTHCAKLWKLVCIGVTASFCLLLRAQHSVVRKSTHIGCFVSEVLYTLCKDSMSICTCVLQHIWFVGLTHCAWPVKKICVYLCDSNEARVKTKCGWWLLVLVESYVLRQLALIN